MSSLSEISTKAPKEFEKKETKALTSKIMEELDELQKRLYAEKKHSILIVLQGLDASGKDGLIRKVFGQMNPQGVRVESFKAPTEKELAHDFLWRIHQHAPEKGMIQIFNRSHYEDVLITRVHGWCDDATALKRFDAINDFEELLTLHNNTHILKFYLHISEEEQIKRLEERKEDPTKKWKYNKKDKEEAKHWANYMKMYEEVLVNCNVTPWIVVPADQNWYKEHIVAKTFLDTLKSLDMRYPDIKEK